MRISHALIAQSTKNYIQNGIEKLSRTQEKISTGKAILRLSDDPPSLSQVLNARAAIKMNSQYARNITDGLSYLEGTDTALGTAGELLQKAIEYAIQGSNGTLASDDMATIGEQIDKMVDEIIDLANTTVGNKYIFAGTKNSRAPFKREGEKIVYQGNLTRVSREILDQASYTIDAPAVALAGEPGVFGMAVAITDPADPNCGDPPGSNYYVTGGIFDTLLNLASSLKNGDTTGASNSLGELNSQLNHLLRYRVQVGARTNHFESVRDQLLEQEIRLTQVLSNLEDADVARMTVDLAQQQLTYQASLASGARILQISLLDFLR